TREGYLARLGAGAALFAAAVVWRDSPVLVGLDIIALLGILSLCSLKAALRSAPSAPILGYKGASLASAFGAAFGMIPLLFTEIKWRPEVSALRSKHVLALGRGIALALPLILVFGFLLAGADPVFGSFVGKAFSVNLDFGDLVAQLLIMI